MLVGTGTIAPFQAIGNAVPFLHGEDAVGHVLGAVLFLALAVILRASRRAGWTDAGDGQRRTYAHSARCR